MNSKGNIIGALSLINQKLAEWIKFIQSIGGKHVKIVSSGIFIVSLFFCFNRIGVFKYLNNRPSSIHISAQTQRASIALNYYKSSMNFFKPRVQKHVVGDGITGVEFPIIYYLGAICYDVFGFHEIYLRLISLAIVFLGIFYFFKTCQFFLQNALISTLLTLAICTSPVFLFYTPNFLPDAPSVGLQLIAWFYTFKYIHSQNHKDLRRFVLFASLAALIKATSAIIIIIVFCLLVLDKLKFFKKNNRTYIFANHSAVLFHVFISLLIVISWYLYARWVSKHYDYESFALSPVMVGSWNEVSEIFETIVNLWSKQLYAHETYVLILAVIGLLVVLFWKANRLLLTISCLNMVGMFTYGYLFLYQFRWHDYYFIALLPTLLFLTLTVAEIFLRTEHKKLVLFHVLLPVILFFNLKESIRYTMKIYNERYSREIYYWTGDYRSYEDLEPKLRKLGIKREDKVISGFDDTFCASLYLMNQIGTNFGNELTTDDVKKLMNNLDLKYLILNDSVKFNKLYYDQSLSRKVIASHRGLLIYKLH